MKEESGRSSIDGLKWYEHNKARGDYNTFYKRYKALMRIQGTLGDDRMTNSQKENYRVLQGAVAVDMVKALFADVVEHGGSVIGFCQKLDRGRLM